MYRSIAYNRRRNRRRILKRLFILLFIILAYLLAGTIDEPTLSSLSTEQRQEVISRWYAQ